MFEDLTAQGALEYLLVLGAGVMIAVTVITVINSQTQDSRDLAIAGTSSASADILELKKTLTNQFCDVDADCVSDNACLINGTCNADFKCEFDLAPIQSPSDTPDGCCRVGGVEAGDPDCPEAECSAATYAVDCAAFANPCQEPVRCSDGLCVFRDIPGCELCSVDSDCDSYLNPEQNVCYDMFCEKDSPSDIQGKCSPDPASPSCDERACYSFSSIDVFSETYDSSNINFRCSGISFETSDTIGNDYICCLGSVDFIEPSCSELGGRICVSPETCQGSSTSASDGSCCVPAYEGQYILCKAPCGPSDGVCPFSCSYTIDSDCPLPFCINLDGEACDLLSNFAYCSLNEFPARYSLEDQSIVDCCEYAQCEYFCSGLSSDSICPVGCTGYYSASSSNENYDVDCPTPVCLSDGGATNSLNGTICSDISAFASCASPVLIQKSVSDTSAVQCCPGTNTEGFSPSSCVYSCSGSVVDNYCPSIINGDPQNCSWNNTLSNYDIDCFNISAPICSQEGGSLCPTGATFSCSGDRIITSDSSASVSCCVGTCSRTCSLEYSDGICSDGYASCSYLNDVDCDQCVSGEDCRAYSAILSSNQICYDFSSSCVANPSTGQKLCQSDAQIPLSCANNSECCSKSICSSGDVCNVIPVPSPSSWWTFNHTLNDVKGIRNITLTTDGTYNPSYLTIPDPVFKPSSGGYVSLLYETSSAIKMCCVSGCTWNTPCYTGSGNYTTAACDSYCSLPSNGCFSCGTKFVYSYTQPKRLKVSNINVGNPFTFAAFVNIPSSYYTDIFSDYGSDSTHGFVFYADQYFWASNRKLGVLYSNSADGGSYSNFLGASISDYEQYDWYFVSMSKNASNEITICWKKTGSSKLTVPSCVTAPSPGIFADGSPYSYIGSSDKYAGSTTVDGNRMGGEIESAYYWDYALSPEELLAIYNDSVSPFG